MNRTIKNVKLGAPNSITVQNCDTLENLNVQITENLDSITFKGNTGTKNPFERAADLLRQQETELSEEEGFRPNISGLSTKYLPVEWVSNTANIDNNSTYGVDVDFTFTDHTIIFKVGMSGSYNGIMGGGIRLSYGVVSGHIYVNNVDLGGNAVIGKSGVYKVNPDVYVDDVKIFDMEEVENISTVILFNSGGTNYCTAGNKLYYFQAINRTTGELDVDIIPVINRETKEVRLYDKARDRFFDFKDGVGLQNIPFEAGPVLYDTSFSLNIPAENILNGGNTTCVVKSNNTALPAEDYYWQIQNVNPDSTGTPTIDQRGNITMEPNTWADVSIKAKRYNDVSYITSKIGLNLFSKYPGLSSIVAARPELAPIIIEWEDIVNSLMDTGKRNVITQVTGSTAGLINTGIVCSNDMSFRAIVKPSIKAGTNYLFGGGGSTNANKMYQYFNLNSASLRTYMRYAGTENNKTESTALDTWGEYKFDVDSYSILGVETTRTANIGSFVEKPTAPIYIFGAMHNDNGTAFTRNNNTTAGNSISLEVLDIRNGEELHSFVPFVRNGEAGLLDLFDLSFHGNAYTSGEFIITTELRES